MVRYMANYWNTAKQHMYFVDSNYPVVHMYTLETAMPSLSEVATLNPLVYTSDTQHYQKFICSCGFRREGYWWQISSGVRQHVFLVYVFEAILGIDMKNTMSHFDMRSIYGRPLNLWVNLQI